jgi:hypothetical protein
MQLTENKMSEFKATKFGASMQFTIFVASSIGGLGMFVH